MGRTLSGPLYSTDLGTIQRMKSMSEHDSEVTENELSSATDILAPGNNGTMLNLISCCRKPLHGVMCQCLQEGAVPRNMRDAKYPGQR